MANPPRILHKIRKYPLSGDLRSNKKTFFKLTGQKDWNFFLKTKKKIAKKTATLSLGQVFDTKIQITAPLPAEI